MENTIWSRRIKVCLFAALAGIVLALLINAIVGRSSELSRLHLLEKRIEEKLSSVKQEIQKRESELKELNSEANLLREARRKVVEERNSIINKGISAPNVSQVDIEKLAYAVAMAETKNCTLGYGQMYENCFGIKNGSIAPCKKIGQNRMCIYDKPEESYEAFKEIWLKGYGDRFPTYRDAQVYTGNDSPKTWLNNVSIAYNQ